VRQLAEHLAISVNTVRSVYQALEANGLTATRHGAGTRVLERDARPLAQIAAEMRSHTVGVILPSLANPFYHPFLDGVEAVAHRDLTMLFVCNTHDDPCMAARYYAQMASKQVDGIIIASHNTAELVHAPGDEPGGGEPLLTTVTVDWPGCSGPSVLLDLEDAGYQGTRHLLAHGHRRVGLLTVDTEAANVGLVNMGYRRALGDLRIEADTALIAAAPGFDMASGQASLLQLLGLAQPPTAVFAIADTLALGALAEIKIAGLRVPGDLALAGFNDIPTVALVDPPLTSVAAPVREMGAQAMRMLQEQISGRPLAQMHVVLPVALMVRASCGPHV